MLATLAQVKTVIGITGTAEDGALNILLPGIDRALKDLLNQEIEQATYTEYLDSTITGIVRLRQRPVFPADITSVKIDTQGSYGQLAGSFADAALTAGRDYALRVDQPDGSSKCGLLLLSKRSNWGWGGYWPSGGALIPGLLYPPAVPARGSIQVIYKGGYATPPADLVLTVIMVTSKIRQMKKYGTMIASEGYEGYSVAFMAILPDLFDQVRQLWWRYRALEIGN